jgi:hypothetical protein
MGYIINLTVILDGIFKTGASDVTEDVALEATRAHVESGCRNDIHRDICNFVKATSGRRSVAQEKDMVLLEKIIDLIRQYAPFRE